MKILYHKKFIKKYQELILSKKLKIDTSIALFSIDPFNKTVFNHRLNGKWLGFSSISAGGDLRIIYRELSEGKFEVVEIVTLGTHSQLY